MFANHPEMAKEWASKTKNSNNLPERLHPKRNKIKEAVKMLGRGMKGLKR